MVFVGANVCQSTYTLIITTIICIPGSQGIFEPVTLGNRTLGPWKMIGYPLNDTSWLSTVEPLGYAELPALYRTRFTLQPNNGPTRLLDTYLDTTGWKKVRRGNVYRDRASGRNDDVKTRRTVKGTRTL